MHHKTITMEPNTNTTVRNYVVAGKIEEAIGVLNSNLTDDDDLQILIILSAQYKELKRNKLMGLYSHNEETRERNKIIMRVLEIANHLPSENSKPNNNNIKKSEPMKSPLHQLGELYENIEKDIKYKFYSESSIREYIRILNSLFGNVFGSFLDPINTDAYKNAFESDQKLTIKGILERLENQKDRLTTRLGGFVDKQNTEVTLNEALVKFFNTPTVNGWKVVAPLLSVRFADTTLYSTDVVTAWNGWLYKLNQFTDDFDFNFDFRGQQIEVDLQSFLETNLKVKNFNQ